MQTSQDYALETRPDTLNSLPNWQTGISIDAYLTLSIASVVVIHDKAGIDLTEPVRVFAIVGVGFSALAWIVTRRSEPLPFQVEQSLYSVA